MSVFLHITRQLRVSNETLFVALRLCEQKAATSRESNRRILWGKRADQLKNLIVTQNMGCVYKCLSKVRRSQDEEAFSEAMFGVSLALRGYDVNRGFKYTTYLMNVVLRRLYRYIRSLRNCRNINKIEQEDLTASDVFNPDIMTVQELLEHNVACLNDRELDILHQRFWQNRNLNQIGETYRITRESVRLIQNKALEKLHSVMVEGDLSMEELDAKLDLKKEVAA